MWKKIEGLAELEEMRNGKVVASKWNVGYGVTWHEWHPKISLSMAQKVMEMEGTNDAAGNGKGRVTHLVAADENYNRGTAVSYNWSKTKGWSLSKVMEQWERK